MAPGHRESDGRQVDALEHLASIDLIQLCNEAKIERCRATRDLSCCGRYVQHVLKSCGHASLCEECSQRCDACPICRTSLPKSGNRLQLRLYNKCIEAGLISKRYDDWFQENRDSSENLTADIQRLYSLFDVALENNLVSLICHYITDVCMDETAVSSDPVLAFLLDEVVVKDWCKRTFKLIICELQGIYSLEAEAMKSKLPIIQKFGMQLSSISSVLEVMVSSLADTFSAQLHDLHDLFENALKAKQHLEIMTWCIQHQFLEGIEPCHPDFDSWSTVVRERKSAAIKHSWPDYAHNSTDTSGLHGLTLFIEQALSNLSIEESYTPIRGEELDILCLQDGKSPLMFRSKINEVDRNKEDCYPFENLRAAIDVLFLHGTSDTVVAKQAIFLYYLFDRYWTRPDVEWRHFVDDLVACFGIARNSVLESFAFYLLDDHTDQALQEASHLLPEIASPEMHPRIAQVLLERQRPDVALTVLRCSGRDGSCASASLKYDDDVINISLGEAVTAVRVRVECGLLTEAFMYQRMHCFKQKEKKSENGSLVASSFDLKSESWIYHVEVLVSEICYLCIRRNLVDRMIELPWNSDEEKFLHRSFLDYACREPSTTCGSLLVVYYLQRYRYIEAYQVDRKLQSLEQNIIVTAGEEVLSKIRSISNWRSGLVDKCLDLLPEAQRQKVMSGNIADIDGLPTVSVNMPSEFVLSSKPPTSASLSTSSSLMSSLLLHTNLDSSSLRKTKAEAKASPTSRIDNGRLDYGNQARSSLNRKLRASLESPTSKVNTLVADAISSSAHCNGDNGSPNDIIMRDPGHERGGKQRYTSFCTPVEEMSKSASRAPWNECHAENLLYFIPEVTSKEPDSLIDTPNSNGVFRKSVHDQNSLVLGKTNLLDIPSTGITKEANTNFSWRRGDSPLEDQNMKGGPRWRSDESSEEDEDHELDRYVAGGISSVFQKRTRYSRR